MKIRTMKPGIMNHCNVCGLHVKPSKKVRHFQQRHPEYGVYVDTVNGKRKMFCSTCKVTVSSLEFLIAHYKRVHMGGQGTTSQPGHDPITPQPTATRATMGLGDFCDLLRGLLADYAATKEELRRLKAGMESWKKTAASLNEQLNR